MKRKTLSSMIITLLLTTEAITISPFATTKSVSNLTPSCCESSEECDVHNHSDKKHKKYKDDMGFWSNDNINLLNDCQKKQLDAIREKIKKGVALTDDDKKIMIELKDVIAKSKLGEEKFNKFKSLMEKKKSDKKLTDDEKKELKLYMKELR
jgi:hypothetical protein